MMPCLPYQITVNAIRRLHSRHHRRSYRYLQTASVAKGGAKRPPFPQIQPPIFLAIAQKSACDLLIVVSPQSFNTAFCSSGFMDIHAVLKSASDLSVFMPASVKNGDIFAGSSRAE